MREGKRQEIEGGKRERREGGVLKKGFYNGTSVGWEIVREMRG